MNEDAFDPPAASTKCFWQPGDVVSLRRTGTRMTVESVGEEADSTGKVPVCTVWFDEKNALRRDEYYHDEFEAPTCWQEIKVAVNPRKPTRDEAIKAATDRYLKELKRIDDAYKTAT
jgi:uncharacterized protein YodC (DUF2158 family)